MTAKFTKLQRQNTLIVALLTVFFLGVVADFCDLWGKDLWLSRVGGTLVGLTMALKHFEERYGFFTVYTPNLSGHPSGLDYKRFSAIMFYFSLFGTLVWTFGDIIFEAALPIIVSKD